MNGQSSVVGPALKNVSGPAPKSTQLFTILDTETTGLGATDEIIEIGLVQVAYDNSSGKILGVVNEYSSLREPSVALTTEAAAVHGWSHRDLEGQQPDEEIVIAMLAGSAFTVAHNANFDRDMLSRMLRERIPRDIVWRCSCHEIPWKFHGAPSRSLPRLIAWHGREFNAHRALSDAHAVGWLLNEPYRPNEMRTPFEDLLAVGH